MSKHGVFQSVSSALAILVVVFLPQINNGVRNWFTVEDVSRWSNRTGNVMPISCVENNGVFTSCTVEQAQPLTLVWDDAQGKVVVK